MEMGIVSGRGRGRGAKRPPNGVSARARVRSRFIRATVLGLRSRVRETRSGKRVCCITLGRALPQGVPHATARSETRASTKRP